VQIAVDICEPFEVSILPNSDVVDILPTVAALIDADLPEHKIDGKDIRPLMFGTAPKQSPHDAFYCYYANGQLQAVRDRRWKLHFPHGYRTMDGGAGGTGGIPTKYSQARIGLELFDLKTDVGETTNVADANPKIVKRLQRLAEDARADLGDSLTKRKGPGIRKAGQLGPGDKRLGG